MPTPHRGGSTWRLILLLCSLFSLASVSFGLNTNYTAWALSANRAEIGSAVYSAARAPLSDFDCSRTNNYIHFSLVDGRSFNRSCSMICTTPVIPPTVYDIPPVMYCDYGSLGTEFALSTATFYDPTGGYSGQVGIVTRIDPITLTLQEVLTALSAGFEFSLTGTNMDQVVSASIGTAPCNIIAQTSTSLRCSTTRPVVYSYGSMEADLGYNTAAGTVRAVSTIHYFLNETHIIQATWPSTQQTPFFISFDSVIPYYLDGEPGAITVNGMQCYNDSFLYAVSVRPWYYCVLPNSNFGDNNMTVSIRYFGRTDPVTFTIESRPLSSIQGPAPVQIAQGSYSELRLFRLNGLRPDDFDVELFGDVATDTSSCILHAQDDYLYCIATTDVFVYARVTQVYARVSVRIDAWIRDVLFIESPKLEFLVGTFPGDAFVRLYLPQITSTPFTILDSLFSINFTCDAPVGTFLRVVVTPDSTPFEVPLYKSSSAQCYVLVAGLPAGRLAVVGSRKGNSTLVLPNQVWLAEVIPVRTLRFTLQGQLAPTQAVMTAIVDALRNLWVLQPDTLVMRYFPLGYSKRDVLDFLMDMKFETSPAVAYYNKLIAGDSRTWREFSITIAGASNDRLSLVQPAPPQLAPKASPTPSPTPTTSQPTSANVSAGNGRLNGQITSITLVAAAVALALMYSL